MYSSNIFATAYTSLGSVVISPFSIMYPNGILLFLLIISPPLSTYKDTTYLPELVSPKPIKRRLAFCCKALYFLVEFQPRYQVKFQNVIPDHYPLNDHSEQFIIELSYYRCSSFKAVYQRVNLFKCLVLIICL